jgi:uncharacterized protein YndB with AHSA1/START domain
MPDEERLSASRTIRAPAADIFRVVSDPRGHVAIDGSGMLMSAPDAQRLTKVGDTFVIHMDREALGDFPMGKYTVTNIVTKYQPDELLEWTVDGTIQPPIGHVYGYQLEPADDGATLVTSYYDWSAISDQWRESGIFPVIPVTALRVTLGILERVVLARTF